LLDDEPVAYQLAILFTLATGLRIGELIAIHESDLNRINHSVKISKAVSETKEGRKLSTTKTKKIRVEFYPPELEELIDKHLENEKIKKELLGVDNDLIFTSTKGDFMPKRTMQDWFKRFIKRKGLKEITFHGLRHTSATILLANGIPLKNVAERLGHSRASTTANIYAHAIPRIDRDAANVFSNILSTGSRSGSQDKNLKVVK
jgi:integrase